MSSEEPEFQLARSRNTKRKSNQAKRQKTKEENAAGGKERNTQQHQKQQNKSRNRKGGGGGGGRKEEGGGAKGKDSAKQMNQPEAKTGGEGEEVRRWDQVVKSGSGEGKQPRQSQQPGTSPGGAPPGLLGHPAQYMNHQYQDQNQPPHQQQQHHHHHHHQQQHQQQHQQEQQHHQQEQQQGGESPLSWRLDNQWNAFLDDMENPYQEFTPETYADVLESLGFFRSHGEFKTHPLLSLKKRISNLHDDVVVTVRLFKKNIPPCWEGNLDGGRCVCWSATPLNIGAYINLVSGLTGLLIERSIAPLEEISGIVISKRVKSCKVEVWTTGTDPAVAEAVLSVLSALKWLQRGQKLSFYTNADSIAEAEASANAPPEEETDDTHHDRDDLDLNSSSDLSNDVHARYQALLDQQRNGLEEEKQIVHPIDILFGALSLALALSAFLQMT